jgi:hypothetical protein
VATPGQTRTVCRRTYGLRDRPSSDYWTIMDNAFTGYDAADERTVEQWLRA